MKGKVVKAAMNDSREMYVVLDRKIPGSVRGLENVVVENVSWTPEVKITGNRFSRIPTRGVLLFTRKKSLIENNIFYGMHMSAISITDDTMNWFESGPVHDLTIRNNTFIDCGSPVIYIDAEYTTFDGPVQKNITIEENVFESSDPNVKGLYARGVDGLVIRNNFIRLKSGKFIDKIIDCENVTMGE